MAQVSLSGETHSLSPLEASAPKLIHVFSGPKLYRNALWLPYRRDHREVKAAVAMAVQLEGSVKAVFAHADIVSLAALSPHLPVSLTCSGTW